VVKPLEDRVVVKPSTEEERTKGGIVLPDTAKERPQERAKSSQSVQVNCWIVVKERQWTLNPAIR